jgi:hypothetical protein
MADEGGCAPANLNPLLDPNRDDLLRPRAQDASRVAGGAPFSGISSASAVAASRAAAPRSRGSIATREAAQRVAKVNAHSSKRRLRPEAWLALQSGAPCAGRAGLQRDFVTSLVEKHGLVERQPQREPDHLAVTKKKPDQPQKHGFTDLVVFAFVVHFVLFCLFCWLFCSVLCFIQCFPFYIPKSKKKTQTFLPVYLKQSPGATASLKTFSNLASENFRKGKTRTADAEGRPREN